MSGNSFLAKHGRSGFAYRERVHNNAGAGLRLSLPVRIEIHRLANARTQCARRASVLNQRWGMVENGVSLSPSQARDVYVMRARHFVPMGDGVLERKRRN